MNKYQNQNNLSDQFKKAISEALATGDYRNLNTLVSDTVTDALSDAGIQIKNAADNTAKNVSQNYSKMQENLHQYEEQQRERNRRFTKYPNGQPSVSPKKSTLPAIKTKNVGQISGILYTVFGGIGIGTTAIVLLVAFACAAFGFIWPLPIFLLFIALLGGSGLMLSKGIKKSRRLKRMKRYLSLCSGKVCMNLSDLAKLTNKSTGYILKDIKKMLKLGFFPEGHLDEKETCLMLDDATYREYLRVEKERRVYLSEQQTAAAQTAATKRSNTAETEENAELAAIMEEGTAYIQKLHDLNDCIPGEIISEKMYRMENLLKEIFKRLKNDPSQISKMHKLMNYYLPTTIKLLQSYAEFDRVSTPGADILTAKAEIEKTVDTINEAFTELLNKLFQSTVFDVTADAQVLKTMLAKEGLTKNDFSEEKNE